MLQKYSMYRETHFQLGLYAGRVWLTKFGYCSAAAGGVKIDFIIFLEAEWGTGPPRVNSNWGIYVNNIKLSKRHKMALWHTFRETREFVFINNVQFMMSANIRIRFGLQIVLVCLYSTPSHYHHFANLSEGIELIKCLSDIFCRVCEYD